MDTVSKSKEDEERDKEMLSMYIDEANTMLKKCEEMQSIKGMKKLIRNLTAELKYLGTVSTCIK